MCCACRSWVRCGSGWTTPRSTRARASSVPCWLSGVTAVHGLIDLLRGPAPTQEEAIGAIGKLGPDVAADLRRWPAFPAS
jgi:hypothetical protein